jgi:hypothetical protein
MAERKDFELHPPIRTVGYPITIEPPCAVRSPMRAAGSLLIRTVADAFTMTSGGPTQRAISVIRAAGIPPISTVTAHGGRIGPPTCGIGGTPGVTIGQTCISLMRAAGIPMATHYTSKRLNCKRSSRSRQGSREFRQASTLLQKPSAGYARYRAKAC